MKNLKQTLIAGLLIISNVSVFAQGSMGAVKGEILNNDNLPVVGATVKILQGGALIGGTNTDENGRYTYKPLNAGSYDIIISSFEKMSSLEKSELELSSITFVAFIIIVVKLKWMLSKI